jgi:feruloyl-CoA synthase
MVLSGNSIEHALVMLGCYTAGVPAAPISPAYSLISTDHAKLKHCFDKVRRAWSSPRAARCSPRPSRP